MSPPPLILGGMTLSQLAFTFLTVLILGSLATVLDWPALLVAVDSAAVGIARFLLPVWQPLERVLSQ